MKWTRLPYNEFSEFCTGDMADMDIVYHHWMQDKWKDQRETWRKQEEEKERRKKGIHD